MTHSLAAMVETLRGDPGSYGVVSGVGMHMQKHAYGVWSTDPGRTAVVADPPPYCRRGRAGRRSSSLARGQATVATYSVLHGRDGGPERALLVCDLPGGGRCYAAARRRGRRAGGRRGRRADRAHGDADARTTRSTRRASAA